MTETQAILFKVIKGACYRSNTRSEEFSYKSEWLGYLPYGVYHWLEVDGDEIKNGLPEGWSEGDLEALEKAGLISKIREYRNADDEFESKIVYAICKKQKW